MNWECFLKKDLGDVGETGAVGVLGEAGVVGEAGYWYDLMKPLQ